MAKDTTLDKATEDRLRDMVKGLASEVKKEQASQERRRNAGQSGSAAKSVYPAAHKGLKGSSVGVIVDGSATVGDLEAERRISTPENLYWFHAKTYEEFETFLKDYGIPAYISFNHNLGKLGKTGMQCAQLLVQKCKEAKLKTLPEWQVHAPTVTSKAVIEDFLMMY